MSNLLEVADLAVEFATPGGPLGALDGLSFRIKPRSSVALVGESGSGKSVCAQAIMGLLPAVARITRGSILLRDPEQPGSSVDLARLDRRGAAFRRLRGGRIGMIFQEPMTSLSPLHRVGDQIAEVLEVHERLRGPAARARSIEMLKLVRLPDPERIFRSYPFELSGGLRQRAMIAMALVCRPALLVADEPTTALDVTVQAQILGLIRDMQREIGMAVLMITHDMGVVANIAEEVVVVWRGQVMEAGEVREIFEDPRHPYLRALLQAVPRVDADPAERLQPLVDVPRAHETPATPARPGKRAAATPLLAVEGLTKSYTIRSDGWGWGRRQPERIIAVDRVSFEVRPGECLGLVGESGCGKTTVAKMVMGAISPDAGKILFDDGSGPVDIARMDDAALIPLRRKIQYVFQDPIGSLDPRMTVLDLLTEPLSIHGLLDASGRREKAVDLMRRVGIDPRFLNRYPHSFSGGQRQRIGIGRALMLGPELLVCDEPVSALDVSTRAQVLNLLKDLRAELGLTLLFISHDLGVVNYIADRVAVMCRGRLVEVAPRALLFRQPRHPYTKALLASVPHPDMQHPLDFEAIGQGQMTEPSEWPVPFEIGPDGLAPLVDLGGGHLVRSHEARI